MTIDSIFNRGLTKCTYDSSVIVTFLRLLLAFVSVESRSTSSGPLNFIQSQKGGSIAVFEFYTYVKNRNLTGDRTYWTCREEQKRGCKGFITSGSSNDLLIVPFRPLLAERRWQLTSIGRSWTRSLCSRRGFVRLFRASLRMVALAFFAAVSLAFAT